MAVRNVYQLSDWNGDSGERWVANQRRLDTMLAVFGEAAIRTAAPVSGEYVLDIGCGAGATSFSLADKVGEAGHVLGVDISAALIERARSLAPSAIPVRFDLADAGTVALPEGTFDLLFSRFGVMFFDQPVSAFTHLRGLLKPEGRLAFVCWRRADENDWGRIPMGAIRGIVPPSPPPDPEAPGPFSFGQRERVEHILRDAGFADVVITPCDEVIPFGEGETRTAAIEDALEMAFEVGPLSRALIDQPEPVRARAAEAVRRAYAAQPGERSVMIMGAAWIVTAKKG